MGNLVYPANDSWSLGESRRLGRAQYCLEPMLRTASPFLLSLLLTLLGPQDMQRRNEGLPVSAG